MLEKFHIPSWKIGIVHHGIEAPISPEKALKPSLSEKYKESPFLFTAGSLVHYRGFEDIIQAINLIKERYPTIKILIAGKSCRGTIGYEKRMKQLVNQFGLTSRIIWLGEVSRAEMAWCFQHCEAFVMTSRLEACPNIALEALSYGCINISTSLPPMPEIFSEGALYYKSNCPEDLANKIVRVISLSSTKKAEMSEKAQYLSHQFGWSITAKKTYIYLEQAIKHREIPFESCIN